MPALSFPLAIRPYARLQPPKAYDPGMEMMERGNIMRGIPFTLGLLTIALTSNASLTLDATVNGQPMYAGQSGFLQVIQDATGGWAPTWTNATSTDGTIAPPSTGALDPTMYQWVYDGSVFILSLFAQRYASGGTDAAYAMATSRIVSALLPLPRVEVLSPGYALVFS